MKQSVVTIQQAKTNLSRLLRKASAGELKDKLVIGWEFFEPLPVKELSG